jgi:hypothetical protein
MKSSVCFIFIIIHCNFIEVKTLGLCAAFLTLCRKMHSKSPFFILFCSFYFKTKFQYSEKKNIANIQNYLSSLVVVYSLTRKDSLKYSVVTSYYKHI